MNSVAQSIPATLLAAEEFARRYAGDYVELIDGKVEPIPMAGARHGAVCFNAALLVGGFVKQNQLGLICTNDTFVQTQQNPDRVRGADVAYWSRTAWPGQTPPDGLIEAAPDLVIEVRSPSDGWNTVFAKVGEYLTAGVRVVAVLDPATETASVYRKDEFQQIFHNGDSVTFPDVLPGFAVPVARFFES